MAAGDAVPLSTVETISLVTSFAVFADTACDNSSGSVLLSTLRSADCSSSTT